MKYKNTLLFTLVLLVIYFVAWELQTSILLNHDVSWLMQATKRMLAGGSYTKDYFEINPPMILYLYCPPVILAHILSISSILALRVYVFFLATCSLVICGFFLRLGGALLLLTVAITFLILPIYEFGQREHLLLIVTMPYILLVIHRVRGLPIKVPYAFGIGLLAGFGLALKPYFLLIPLLLELYVMYVYRSAAAWRRPEVMAIVLLISSYLLSVVVFHPDYLTVVLPLVSRFYYSGLKNNWFSILSFFPILFCGMMALWYGINRQKDERHLLNPEKTVIFIAMFSCFLVYILGRAPWYYHSLPAYSLAIILAVLLVQELAIGAIIRIAPEITSVSCAILNRVFVFFLAATVFILPITYSASFYVGAAERKVTYRPLIQFLQDHAAHKSVYFFVTSASEIFPFLDYAEVSSSSRMAFLGWIAGGWIPGLYDGERHEHQPTVEETFLINMVTDDIRSNQPALIFVDMSKKKGNAKKLSFDYMGYFLADQAFNNVWKSYQYLTSVSLPGHYQYDVYQRKTNEA